MAAHFNKVLHLTGHLGGGVGRALSALAAHNRQGGEVADSFICLEAPRDGRFAEAICDCGADILIAPEAATIRQAMRAADIVQIEWWHHPLLARLLIETGDIAARYVVWAHTSGLHYPAITPAFAALPDAFVATSAASMPLLSSAKIKGAVHSTGGFDALPLPAPRNDGRTRAGYLGSLNPAKLHPDILRYIAAVGRDDFSVDFYGEEGVNPRFEEEARRSGSAQLRGFCARPQDVLPTFDLFVYLLNPTHYGTTENALLEAMACGAVPIVLNNPVESGIVRHGVTGFVVDSPRVFAETIRFLLDHPQDRQRMGLACAQAVRRDFSVARSARELAKIYRAVMECDRRSVDFSSVFGKTPADIFLSCLGKYAPLFAEGNGLSRREERLALPMLYEKSKASVSQFHSYFPDSARLVAWKEMLENDMAFTEGRQR